jgi:subtilisin family serine protease
LKVMLAVTSLVSVVAGLNIGPDVLDSLTSTGRADVLFILPGLDLDDRPTAVSDKDASKLVNDLQEHAVASQQTLLAHLTNCTTCTIHRSFWASNAISAVVTDGLFTELTTDNTLESLGVESIVSNKAWKTNLEAPDPVQKEPSKGEAEWNVEWIKAGALYQKGFRGKGMVVGNADTGIEYTHPALVNSYRGSPKGHRKQHFDHDYNWFDATQIGPLPPQVTPASSSCVQGVDTPCDDHGHGTHTVGTSVGTLEGIGVAPEAKWVGCRNMFAGYGTPASYLGCLEFFVAPTKLDGSGVDASLRPHAIGNSYGCPTNEGCSFDTFRHVFMLI